MSQVVLLGQLHLTLYITAIRSITRACVGQAALRIRPIRRGPA